MAEFEDKIEAVGEDGVKYYLPKQSVVVHQPDWKARSLAVGSLLVATGAVVYEVARTVLQTPVQPVSSSLVSTIEAIQTQQALNETGDRFNEDALRSLFGVDPLEDESHFWRERDFWYKKYKGTPAPTEEATPVP